MDKELKQMTLEGFDSDFINGYKCHSCLQFFQTMREVSKHTTRHAKRKRKSKTINYCLEEFGFITSKNYELRNIQHLHQLSRVKQ